MVYKLLPVFEFYDFHEFVEVGVFDSLLGVAAS